MTIALTRAVSPSLARCELTHLAREPIDVTRAAMQHESYQQCLINLGVDLVRLLAEPELPDAVFVEDTAVVLDELAIITRPGVASRRPRRPASPRLSGRTADSNSSRRPPPSMAAMS
ncbi:MAG: hypothetical protein HKM89_08695 [Gemmatimonadales bacterium]|nr:hypothetical protein [Gemmatimonadales bacterium]